LSTACTTTLGVDCGTATFSNSHPETATAALSATDAILKMDRDTSGRQERKL
jgi:hypothetical protein